MKALIDDQDPHNNEFFRIKAIFDEITAIKLKTKGNFLTGALLGLGLSLIATNLMVGQIDERGQAVRYYSILLGIPSSLLGGAITRKSRYKTYPLRYAKPEEQARIIEVLKAHARFKEE
jgi:hypothetical protein